MHEVKPKSYTLQPEKYVQDFKNFLLVTNYQQISKDGRKKPHLLQILEISLIQRKATALTLLGSGKLLRTEKKCSFITGGQRKTVLCPWHNFHPSKRSGQSFLWVSRMELREPSAVLPEQKPLEKKGTAPGKCLCCRHKEQKIAKPSPPSAVTCFYPSLHISPLT